GCALGARDGSPVEPRVIGYLGYELGHRVSGLGARAQTQIVQKSEAGPDMWLAAYGAVARCGAELEIVGPDTAARDRLAGALATGSDAPALAPRFGPL